MLKPYPMSSIIITGPAGVQEKVVNELHNLKVLHIVDHSKSDLADIGKPLDSANKLSELLVRVRALATSLNISLKEEIGISELKKDLLEINSAVNKLNVLVNFNLEELKKIDELISKNLKDASTQELEILKGISIPLESLSPYKSLACIAGYLKDNAKVEEVKSKLPKITNNFILLDGLAGKKSLIVLFVEAKAKEQAEKLLQENSFLPVKFSNIGNYKGTASSNLKKIEEEVLKLEKKKEGAKKKLESLSAEYRAFLIAADRFLAEQLEKAEAPLRFASTATSFLVKGWVPSSDLSMVIGKLNKAANNKIFISFEPAKKSEKVPIKLKNPKPINSFEILTGLYAMPLYKEFDPTFFLFLTFPLLFGFMLGDFGYGLLTLLIFILLKKKMPKARHFFNILILSSLSSMVFGIIFGEFFGYEELFGREIPHLLSRSHELIPLLFIAIGIGVLHITIGLIVGFFNEKSSHGLMHAIYAKGGWLVLLAGVLMLAGFYTGIAKIPPYVGYALIAVSIFMLFKGEGFKGIIELPSIFSNILSYARLMAIGVSSVELAIVINKQVEPFFHTGGFMIIFGILILVIGHTVNIALGLMGSFLHSLRLHYVEFFTKFFEGGAIRYSPFGSKS